MPATVLRDGWNPTTSADTTATILTTTDTSPTPDDDPLPVLHLAFYLPFRQRWELLGYSRGALLSSLSLAPQEETTIEVFSWDRRKRSTEVAAATEAETTTEASESSRDSREVLHEVTRESDIKTHVGADLGVQADEVHLGVQASGDTQDKVKDFAKDTRGHFCQAACARCQCGAGTAGDETSLV